MPSTLDTIREALQVALLPKLTAIEKDLQTLRAEIAQSNQALRAEIAQSNQELRAEGIENYQGLRAEMNQNNQALRAEMRQSNQELRAELELKFSILLSEIQKVGIRTELTADKIKAETETYVHRSITPLAERVAVLEMSFRTLKEKLERASQCVSGKDVAVLNGMQGLRSFRPMDEDLSMGTPPWGRADLRMLLSVYRRIS